MNPRAVSCFVGNSVRAIAKQYGRSVAEINHVIDAWTETVTDDKIRKHTLVLEFARLDELQSLTSDSDHRPNNARSPNSSADLSRAL